MKLNKKLLIIFTILVLGLFISGCEPVGSQVNKGGIEELFGFALNYFDDGTIEIGNVLYVEGPNGKLIPAPDTIATCWNLGCGPRGSNCNNCYSPKQITLAEWNKL